MRNRFFCKFQLHRWGILLLLILLCSGIPQVMAIDVSVTGDIQNWVLNSGTTTTDPNTVKLSVSSTANSWTIGVKDNLDPDNNGDPKSISSAGKMLEYNITESRWINTTGRVLSSNLTVAGEELLPVVTDYHSVSLGPTERVIAGGGMTSGTKVLNISVSQLVSSQDQRLINGNKYRVVITFVGTDLT